MITIELDKKTKKNIYDINQDLKTVFGKYNIYPDNVIISNNISQMPSLHCAMLKSRDNFPKEFDNIVVSFNSTSIYTAYNNKEFKSHITHIFLDNGFIYIGDSEECREQIGSYYHLQSINGKKFKIFKDIATDVINDFESQLQLHEDTIKKLCKGSLIKIEPPIKKYKTRFSKGVIPGLKKSTEVDICFRDHIANNSLYHIILCNTRSKVLTYHQRTCIEIKAKE